MKNNFYYKLNYHHQPREDKEIVSKQQQVNKQ